MEFKRLLIFAIKLQRQERVIFYAPRSLEIFWNKCQAHPDPVDLLTSTERKYYERYLKTWEIVNI